MMDSQLLNQPLSSDKLETMSSPQTDNKPEVFTDRTRTNILRVPEQKTLAFLCQIMPPWVSSDLLTFIGMVGSSLVLASFILGKINKYYLFISVVGYAVNWFGDSLDGRVAYFRNKPRKWYGFALDMNMDWLSTVMMGCGFYYYLPEPFKLFAFAVIVFYGWTMIIAQMKYKLAGVYAIDSSYVGPTELRILICIAIITEIFIPGTAGYFTVLISAILFLLNTKDFFVLLKMGNDRDHLEAERKQNNS